MTKRKGTETSSFGSPGRSSHDSSPFYDSRLYQGQTPDANVRVIENPLPAGVSNHIYHHSSEEMSELPDHSIHLMITSPPYNARKEYDEDLTLAEYQAMLRRVFLETYRVLVTGGRACINIANLGRKPYIPLHAMIIQEMIQIGFLMRGEIIWNKASSASTSTAWGSWLSAANPVLRDIHEYILVFCKESFSRSTDGKDSTIEKDDLRKEGRPPGSVSRRTPAPVNRSVLAQRGCRARSVLRLRDNVHRGNAARPGIHRIRSQPGLRGTRGRPPPGTR
jgi:hypothetical protein